ncbi:CAP domain-containing protein [Kineococcus sp. SYSU DK006]|uniref:CAP domain-containing protein n=1 Tax=Kineococcus sp. SYSU DK006 TaxID=3383127 RepID=UPI003D7C6A56
MDTARRPARTRRALGLAAVATAAAALVGGAGAAHAAPATTGDGAAAWRSYELVNAARASAGLAPLVLTEEANRVATDWAFRMAGDSRLQHNPDLAHQLTGYRFYAENVGVGADAEQLHGAFMASPAHRDNVLRPQVSVVGFGAVRSADGRVWIVEVFEQPDHPVTPLFPAPATAQPAAAPAAQPLPVPAGEVVVGAAAPDLERRTRDAR